MEEIFVVNSNAFLIVVRTIVLFYIVLRFIFPFIPHTHTRANSHEVPWISNPLFNLAMVVLLWLFQFT